MLKNERLWVISDSKRVLFPGKSVFIFLRDGTLFLEQLEITTTVNLSMIWYKKKDEVLRLI